MKYFFLKEVEKYLFQNTSHIKSIKRVANNTIFIEFNDKNTIHFDLTKSNSFIYKKRTTNKAFKDFNAPFDLLLQKKFNNSNIEDICLYNDDKILNIKIKSKSSYKTSISILQLEFTGKHTNIIILDENRIILEALRHIDEFSSIRVVKVGIKLEELAKKDFIPKPIMPILDFNEHLYKIYDDIEQNEFLKNKIQKISQINKKKQKLEQLSSSLESKEELEKLSQTLYEKASLILSNLHLISSYQKSFSTIDKNNEEIEITLEECSSVPKYANNLFAKAKKAKKKASNVGIEKNNLETKLEFFNRMILNLENSKTIDDLEFFYPKKNKNQIKTKKSEQYESFFFETYKIMLGTSQKENIFLLKHAKASDFWFHLKDIPSCHVLVQNTKKSIPLSVIEQAAKLCAKFSLDSSGTYKVDYTQRRNVKIQHGANVLYNPYSTIVVKI